MEIYCKTLLIAVNVNHLIATYRIMVSNGVTSGNTLSCSQHHFSHTVIKMGQ